MNMHTHDDAYSRPFHTHQHPGPVAGHRHDDCWLVRDGEVQQLRVGSPDGPRLPGEVTPLEALIVRPSPEVIAAAVAELATMAAELAQSESTPPAPIHIR